MEWRLQVVLKMAMSTITNSLPNTSQRNSSEQTIKRANNINKGREKEQRHNLCFNIMMIEIKFEEQKEIDYNPEIY